MVGIPAASVPDPFQSPDIGAVGRTPAKSHHWLPVNRAPRDGRPAMRDPQLPPVADRLDVPKDDVLGVVVGKARDERTFIAVGRSITGPRKPPQQNENFSGSERVRRDPVVAKTQTLSHQNARRVATTVTTGRASRQYWYACSATPGRPLGPTSPYRLGRPPDGSGSRRRPGRKPRSRSSTISSRHRLSARLSAQPPGAWRACCRATCATASRAPRARPFPRSSTTGTARSSKPRTASTTCS